MRKIILFLGLIAYAFFGFANIKIVVAENFYGDVAQTIGGQAVQVDSIMNNPNQDPHLFSASPSVAKAIERADIVIANGVGYDSWMNALYTSSSRKAIFINVAQLLGKANDVNPHLWYDPATMPTFAENLTQTLIKLDPPHRAFYQHNLSAFLQQSQAYQQSVAKIKAQVQGESVTATEPVAGYLLGALGLNILNQRFQWDMMNGADLSPQEVAQFQDSLTQHQVKLLVYNDQVSDPTTQNLKALALANQIPVIGVSETMPVQQHYYGWMCAELTEIAGALQSRVNHACPV